MENTPDEKQDVEKSQNVEPLKVKTRPSDPEIRSLYEKFVSKKLDVRPAFQRNDVWSENKSSLLIESALLGMPIPVIYLAEEADGKLTVIDGQQRLLSFFKFIKGKYALKKLEYFNGKKGVDLNGKYYSELSEDIQDKIKSTVIRTITIEKESDEILKFLTFERLNKGAISLTEQELRNCIYRGKYNDFLKDLAKHKDFLYLLSGGNKEKEEELKLHSDHVQYVLRFAAYYHSKYSGSSLKDFMNNDMIKYSNEENFTKKEADKLRTSFKTAVAVNKSLFGRNAFRKFTRGNEDNPNGEWSTKFNKILYELSMVSFAKYDKNTLMQHVGEITEAWINFMCDEDFINKIYNDNTSNKKKVEHRFNKWEAILGDILSNTSKEPRCFSKKTKELLYRKDPTCAICGEDINHIDDAAVDHILQYHQGGKTDLSNARLVHRYCNNTRPRTDKPNTEIVLEVNGNALVTPLAEVENNELSEEFKKFQEQADSFMETNL